MIPFGPVYRELRTLMLDVFPEDMPAPGPKGSNLSKWIESGTYSVSRHDPKRVWLVISRQDIAAALLRDVEFLVDSCFEQFLDIATHSDTPTRSPAWGIVTSYYYAFFAAQALSRIIGRPITYLDEQRTNTIKALSSSPISIGSGSFSVVKTKDLSASQAEFQFTKSKLRPHDAVWKTTFHFLAELQSKHKPAARSTDLAATQEFQLYGSLTSSRPFSAFTNGDFNWPSEVRYEANYRVGNAYTMLRTPWHFKTSNMLRNWKEMTTESLLSVMRTSLANLSPDDDIEGLKTRSKFLLDTANTIFALVRGLQTDLHGRRSTDSRWENNRKRFCKKHSSIFSDSSSWLFPSV